MASSNCPPDDFACPVCLEVLHDPATIPCGHTYCLRCIQVHWDKASAKGSYSCPQCRQVFKPRPILGRNTMLIEAMKKLRVGEQDMSSFAASSTDSPQSGRSDGSEGMSEGASVQLGLYPQLPSTSPKLCPVHQQVLEFYCCDDKESVCDECTFKEHKGHRLVCPDEEKEQELEKKKAMLQRSIQEREIIIQTLPQVFQAHKTKIQEMQREHLVLFGEVMKSMELMRSQIVELLQAYETSTYSHIESHRYRLQHEISQLYKQDEELKRLANTQDSIQFLKTIETVGGADSVGKVQLEISSPESMGSGIRSALEDFRVQLQDLCKGSLASVFRVVNDAEKAAISSNVQAVEMNPINSQAVSQQTNKEEHPPGVMSASNNSDSKPKITPLPPAMNQQPAACSVKTETKSASSSVENPAPKTREEMMKFQFVPTLDHNSAYRHIRLSDGDHKATLRAENQNYPEHVDRFLYWRQVMCKEPLAGSPYYWEVEWTGQKVTIGVAYKDMGRSAADDSSRLGHNERSWSLYWSGTTFSLWHAGKETVLAAPKAKRIGVYLDQQAGILAFYRVSHNQAHQICCVETEFSEPLFPGFRFWSGVGCTITICQLN